jgi:hypothetical protein
MDRETVSEVTTFTSFHHDLILGPNTVGNSSYPVHLKMEREPIFKTVKEYGLYIRKCDDGLCPYILNFFHTIII